jgi:hypothetical protein
VLILEINFKLQDIKLNVSSKLSVCIVQEFRDAIESLSPEQQRFAKAIRAMQLESTLFGM